MLGATAVLAVLAATLLSYAHRAIGHAAARRDYGDDARDGGDRRPDAADLGVRPTNRWQDEDTRLLARPSTR